MSNKIIKILMFILCLCLCYVMLLCSVKRIFKTEFEDTRVSYAYKVRLIIQNKS